MISEEIKLQKTCTKCGMEHPLEGFGPNWGGFRGRKAECRRCRVDRGMMERFGVGVEYLEERVKIQKGRCGVCGVPVGDAPRLDWDRLSGEPRGVVCHGCLTVLGLLGDSEERMKDVEGYVRRWRG